MPLIIPNELPAAEALQSENIFTMDRGRAVTQDIRPLKIVIVNLMPTKIATETQLARVLSNSPLQVEMTLVTMDSHESTHISQLTQDSNSSSSTETRLSTRTSFHRNSLSSYMTDSGSHRSEKRSALS